MAVLYLVGRLRNLESYCSGFQELLHTSPLFVICELLGPLTVSFFMLAVVVYNYSLNNYFSLTTYVLKFGTWTLVGMKRLRTFMYRYR